MAPVKPGSVLIILPVFVFHVIRMQSVLKSKVGWNPQTDEFVNVNLDFARCCGMVNACYVILAISVLGASKSAVLKEAHPLPAVPMPAHALFVRPDSIVLKA
eukprot:Lithocolla_globosa_v1_NODE_345_length_4393_cov_6.676349.p9 type:complete len:102 gc:universal NODE_345_length_4393_cov_6.676349:3480-3785(+)